MGKEVLSVPEEVLPDVVRVIRAGLRSEVVPHEVRDGLSEWCHKMLPGLPKPKKRAQGEQVRVLKIGIDIGGVLTKYPETVRPFMDALRDHPAFEIHLLTDMPREKALKMLVANGVRLDHTRLHACDYAIHGEACKAVKARELGLDMLWDDHMGYVATEGAPSLRLFVMPDPSRDYYHPTWKTPGDNPAFGRVHQLKAAVEAAKTKPRQRRKK